MKSKKYDDIIQIHYPFELNHARMDISNRAAQFSAFKALSGYDDEINEATRMPDTRFELYDHTEEILNKKLQILKENISLHPVITIKYFIADTKKPGGEYVTIHEKILKIDVIKKSIETMNNCLIPIDDIYEIEGKIFEDYLCE